MEPEEISADALSVRGFEQYRCDDYHLGMADFFFTVSQLGVTILSFVHSFISYLLTVD